MHKHLTFTADYRVSTQRQGLPLRLPKRGEPALVILGQTWQEPWPPSPVTLPGFGLRSDHRHVLKVEGRLLWGIAAELNPKSVKAPLGEKRNPVGLRPYLLAGIDNAKN